MGKVKEWFNKPFVKSVVLGGLTIFIGMVSSALGAWDYVNDKAFPQKLILLIIGVALYITALAFYSAYEVNLSKVTRLYKAQNEAFEDLMSGIMSSCKLCANGANEIIHSIVCCGEADLRIWNFDKACQWICNDVYSLLCVLGDGREFEVIYDRLVEDTKPEEYIYTNAYANKNQRKPSVYQEKRKFREDTYHDCELFKNGESDIEVVIGSSEIDKIFEHRSKEKRNKNKDKYSQYIAIPVFCNDNKMIGLFEIVCLNKTKLGDSKADVEEVASRYLIPYSFLLLVMHKLEKALLAQPAEKRV